MLNPSLVLLGSIAVALVLMRMRLHPGLALFVGSLILASLVLPLHSIPPLMLRSLFDRATIRLLVVVASALALSSLMEEKGLLVRLGNTMEGISVRLAIHVVPAVIGLVPMLGGALVSATAVRPLLKRLGLTPEEGTFINYWFRHIWEFSVPVYPAIIVTSVIFAIPILSAVKTLSLMTFLAIGLGLARSYWLLRKAPKLVGRPAKRMSIAYDLLRASWPILLLVVLILARVEAMIAFPLTLILLAGQQRANWPVLKKAGQYALEPRILLLLYAIMLYKATIESSGVAGALIANMQAIGLPSVVVLIALPLLMSLATGLSMAFAGIALPLLVPFITSPSGVNGSALLLAYVSGMMGVLLSPLHLCLNLSAEYLKANLAKVYRYTLPLCLAMMVIAVVLYYVIG